MECHNSDLDAVDPRPPRATKSYWELKKQLQVCHNVLRTEFGRNCTLTGELCEICKEVIAELTHAERVASPLEPTMSAREMWAKWPLDPSWVRKLTLEKCDLIDNEIIKFAEKYAQAKLGTLEQALRLAEEWSAKFPLRGGLASDEDVAAASEVHLAILAALSGESRQ